MKVLQGTIAVAILLVGALASASWQPPDIDRHAEPNDDALSEPLGTYIDCQDSCRNCQKACESKSAGSERSDCMRACTASAAGCCARYGKKPPPGLTCYCQ